MKNPGTVVRGSDVLAEIACRDDRLQAELMVPQRGLAMLRAGQPVKLRYDAFPYQRYGVRYATLRWISPASSLPSSRRRRSGRWPISTSRRCTSAGSRAPCCRGWAGQALDRGGTPLAGQLRHRAAAPDARSDVDGPARRERVSMPCAPRGYENRDATLDDFVSSDPPMQACLERARLAARTDLPVLILGESGTGKTILARAIHNSSERAGGPFVSFNAAALSETLLDSQLFGHERGAFTGAQSRVKGKFELADRGTLFLDEIADLSPQGQSKILRAIEYGEFERLGSETLREADVRVLSATHHPPRHADRGQGVSRRPVLSHQRRHRDGAAAARATPGSSGAGRERDRARQPDAGKVHRRTRPGRRRPAVRVSLARQPARAVEGGAARRSR